LAEDNISLSNKSQDRAEGLDYMGVTLFLVK